MEVDMDRQLEGRSVMVVGVDFSETSHQAVSVALNLARITRAPDLHFIHVLRPVALTGLSDWSGAVEQYERAVETARRELDTVCSSAITKYALRAFAHVRTGEPYREVVQLASDIEADLVIIGTHSRARMSRFLLGSVAEKVQRYAPCPVLTVKPKERPHSSDIEPPCLACHEIRVESHGARLWCDQHVNMAHSFFPRSEPPPYDGARPEQDENYEGNHRNSRGEA
jgi:nucleotide-binding universal stress UspA family protein